MDWTILCNFPSNRTSSRRETFHWYSNSEWIWRDFVVLKRINKKAHTKPCEPDSIVLKKVNACCQHFRRQCRMHKCIQCPVSAPLCLLPPRSTALFAIFYEYPVWIWVQRIHYYYLYLKRVSQLLFLAILLIGLAMLHYLQIDNRIKCDGRRDC